jgi:hypothetical protein
MTFSTQQVETVGDCYVAGKTLATMCALIIDGEPCTHCHPGRSFCFLQQRVCRIRRYETQLGRAIGSMLTIWHLCLTLLLLLPSAETCRDHGSLRKDVSHPNEHAYQGIGESAWSRHGTLC